MPTCYGDMAAQGMKQIFTASTSDMEKSYHDTIRRHWLYVVRCSLSTVLRQVQITTFDWREASMLIAVIVVANSVTSFRRWRYKSNSDWRPVSASGFVAGLFWMPLLLLLTVTTTAGRDADGTRANCSRLAATEAAYAAQTVTILATCQAQHRQFQHRVGGDQKLASSVHEPRNVVTEDITVRTTTWKPSPWTVEPRDDAQCHLCHRLQSETGGFQRRSSRSTVYRSSELLRVTNFFGL